MGISHVTSRVTLVSILPWLRRAVQTNVQISGFRFLLVKKLSISTKSGAEDGVLGGDDASDTMATVYGGACPGSSYGELRHDTTGE